MQINDIILEYLKLKGIEYNARTTSHRLVFRRNLRIAKELLAASGGNVGEVINRVRQLDKWAKSNNLSWSLETVAKRWHDDNTPKQRPYFIDHGKRYEMVNKDGQWYVIDGGKQYHYSGSKKDIQYD